MEYTCMQNYDRLTYNDPSLTNLKSHQQWWGYSVPIRAIIHVRRRARSRPLCWLNLNRSEDKGLPNEYVHRTKKSIRLKQNVKFIISRVTTTSTYVRVFLFCRQKEAHQMTSDFNQPTSRQLLVKYQIMSKVFKGEVIGKHVSSSVFLYLFASKT